MRNSLDHEMSDDTATASRPARRWLECRPQGDALRANEGSALAGGLGAGPRPALRSNPFRPEFRRWKDQIDALAIAIEPLAGFSPLLTAIEAFRVGADKADNGTAEFFAANYAMVAVGNLREGCDLHAWLLTDNPGVF